MTLKVPNCGEARFLEHVLKQTALEDLVLRLYANDRTPAEGDVAADYTEVAGGGYAAITLDPADWTIVEGAPTTATQPAQTLSFTALVGNVYGYYVTEASSGILMKVERFSDGPYDVAGPAQIRVTPVLTLE